MMYLGMNAEWFENEPNPANCSIMLINKKSQEHFYLGKDNTTTLEADKLLVGIPADKKTTDGVNPINPTSTGPPINDLEPNRANLTCTLGLEAPLNTISEEPLPTNSKGTAPTINVTESSQLANLKCTFVLEPPSTISATPITLLANSTGPVPIIKVSNAESLPPRSKSSPHLGRVGSAPTINIT